MAWEKTSFEKKSPFLDLFHTHQPASKNKHESKGTSELKGSPEPKGRLEPKERLEKENLSVEPKRLNDEADEPSPLSLHASPKKDAQNKKIDFITRTEEISFDHFLKSRPDKRP